jgi:hypothetical protein
LNCSLIFLLILFLSTALGKRLLETPKPTSRKPDLFLQQKSFKKEALEELEEWNKSSIFFVSF